MLDQKTWPPESLRGMRPAVPAGATLYSVTIAVQAAKQNLPEVVRAAGPGMEIEAFSAVPFPSALTGRRIAATVELTGTTLGRRWMVTQIEELPQ